jgi:hypothetical protein
MLNIKVSLLYYFIAVAFLKFSLLIFGDALLLDTIIKTTNLGGL